MATSFQPEQPHEPARGGMGRAGIILWVILALLVVVMAVTVLLPRL